MSEARNETAMAVTSKLDVLLIAVSMAAPSPNHNDTSSAKSSRVPAVEPAMSAASTNNSLEQDISASTTPLVTPPSTIELLDQSAPALPIFTEHESSHKSQSFPTTSSLPSPKMIHDQSMFSSSLPIKKRFTHREGRTPMSSILYSQGDGNAKSPEGHVAPTTQNVPPLAAATPSAAATSTNNATKKKAKKKYRKPTCTHPQCTNRVMNQGVCARHGARVRICSFPECSKYAQKGGVCIRHGAKKEYKRCSVKGCNSRVKYGNGMDVCSRHWSTCGYVGSFEVVNGELLKGGEEARQEVNDGRIVDGEQQRDVQGKSM